MWTKSSGKSTDIQNRLDDFINDLDHLNESPANNQMEEDPFGDDADLSWLNAEAAVQHGGDDAFGNDYSGNTHEDEKSTRRSGNIFGLFAVASVLISAILWFVWPGTDIPAINDSAKKIVAENNADGIPTSVIYDKHGIGSDNKSVSPDTQQVAVTKVLPEAKTATATAVADLSIKPVKQEPVKKIQKAPMNATVEKPVMQATIDNKNQKIGPAKHIAPAVAVSDNTLQTNQRRVLTVSVNLGLIREEPSRKSKVVARLKKGTQVITVSRQGDWYQVRFPNGRMVWGHQSIF